MFPGLSEVQISFGQPLNLQVESREVQGTGQAVNSVICISHFTDMPW